MISRNHSLAAGALALSLVAAACGGGPTSPEEEGSGPFTGTWQGNWQRTSCVETGGAVGVACNQTPTSGVLRLIFTQNGSSVSGNVEVASFVIPGSGSVNGSGTLTFTGSAHLQNATETISNWSTTRSGPSMSGSFTLAIVADNPAFGSQTVVLTLQNVTRQQ
jgi:hypothetical protein